MISFKADFFIDYNRYDSSDLIDDKGFGYDVVKSTDARFAVEIAEQEMINKALSAYVELCESYVDGRCLDGGVCTDCQNAFKQKLIEEGICKQARKLIPIEKKAKEYAVVLCNRYNFLFKHSLLLKSIIFDAFMRGARTLASYDMITNDE